MTNVSSIASRPGLVGRDREIVALEAALARTRMVALRGAPGVGKSRLAAEVVRRSELPSFVVECRSLHDVEGLVAAMGAALGLSLTGADPSGSIAASLAARGRCIVVLESFEEIPSAGVRAVESWVARARQCHVVVTSRHVVDGDLATPMLLEPLGVEGPRSDAVTLLATLARRVRPDFHEPDEAMLTKLAVALDGLPLAIELAAPRVATLGTRALLERLDTLLAWRAPEDPERASSLESAIDASWQLLEPAERSVLAQCSVFTGSFDLRAAEAVVDPGLSLADALVGLDRKSLLRVLSPRGGRFALLSSIRELAARRLSPEESARVAARHADHFAAEATRRSTQIHGRDDAAAMAWFASEMDELVRIVEAGGPRSLETALALAPYWVERGPFERGRRLLERALAAPHPEGLEAAALLAHANIAIRLGRPRDYETDVRRALAMAEAASDAEHRSMALRILGEIEWWAGGSLARARALMESAVDASSGGATYTQALARQRLGQILVELGETEAGAAQAESALSLFLRAGVARRAVRQLCSLALAELGAGHVEPARAALARAEEMARDLPPDAFAQVMRQEAAAELMHREGRLTEAFAAWEECSALALRLGYPRNAAVFLGYAGVALRQIPQRAAARERLHAAVEQLGEIGDPRVQAYFAAMLGGLDAEEGRVEEAERAITRAEQVCREHGGPALARAAAIQLVVVERARASLAASPREARAAGERAVARLAALEAEPDAARFDVRSFEVVLSLALARSSIPVSVTRDALVVEREGRFFVTPEGARADLRRSPVLRMLLVALARARTERPGTTLDTDTLVAACWPGERMLRKSASDRLRVSLATLRRLGLRRVLQRDGLGWRLDPSVACEWVTDPAP